MSATRPRYGGNVPIRRRHLGGSVVVAPLSWALCCNVSIRHLPANQIGVPTTQTKTAKLKPELAREHWWRPGSAQPADASRECSTCGQSRACSTSCATRG
eukprot:720373-Prymnesium_polylepis.1